MPRDITMPQLGMAQDAGRLVSWLKAPGDAVARGDALFEVETDKATMEVEAQADGYLTDVTAAEGDDVPVGQVIARISDSPDATGPQDTGSKDTGSKDTGSKAGAAKQTDSQGTEAAGADDDDPASDGGALPDGKAVTMPQLGMAQDTGILVGWHKSPGDAVSADDVLFEVETDKSTMEVEAGRDGYLAATLAEAGEEVPVGEAVAIISAERPENPVARSVKQAGAAADKAKAPASDDKGEGDKPTAASRAPASQSPSTKSAPGGAAKSASSGAQQPSGGRILASPKARRLALEQGLDLSRLAQAGHPQPYHVKDIETLKAMPESAGPDAATASATSTQHLTADVPDEAFSDFAAWAADHADLRDAAALLAGLAGGCLEADSAIVAHEAFGRRRLFSVPRGRLGAVAEVDDGAPDLVVRDLRATRVSGVRLGAADAPTLTLTMAGAGLSLTLECAPDHLPAARAVSLIADFAGRLEQPLRHLL